MPTATQERRKKQTAPQEPAASRSAITSTAARPALRVVAIGGGTGLSTLLRGLKRHVATPVGTTSVAPAPCDAASCLISDLAAVVTVTDDGGSSGRLREDLKMLPPGDIRNCMVALSEDEHMLSRLFQYRFGPGEGSAASGKDDGSGSGLEGHSFGNLFVAALHGITGDFVQAVQMSSQILATRGRIYPSTSSWVTLAAHMDDGSEVRGETNITASKRRILELMLVPETVEPLPETLEAIANADLITLGPGSLYTSLITNLLVKGIPEALAAAKGTRVFICNLMTQANESIGLTASQHIERIYEHTGQPIFDYALVNTSPVSAALLEKYAAEGACPIEADLERVRSLDVHPVAGNFIYEGDVLRHDYDRVTDALLKLGFQGRMPSPLSAQFNPDSISRWRRFFRG